jgi:CPA2 family monovalent cation:H+ antiporter-2
MDTNSFFQDLAVILTVVGFVAAVFTRLGWPKVIGYILAGTIIGKYTLGGSFVINEGSIKVLGQIGVVFLMFTMGLDFSVRKLRKVGHVIFPTAVLDMAVMMWAGHFIGTKLLGWGTIQSLFLGAAISDSATTLLAKTIDEMGWGGRRFTRTIFGVTIVEDILCIGVIALLTGVVNSGSLELSAVARSLGALVLFLTGVTVFGLLLVPRVLNRVARLKDDESLLLTMLGFCFLVSFIAAKLNFSLALGAFLMGVVGAESEPVRRIYQQCVPLRTLFSAIFFVTIGLLVDPVQMLHHGPLILCLSAVVIVAKSVNCTVGSLLTGQDLKSAVQTGLGLAQIGEFAYLVALIGVSLKAVDTSLYQIAVGVSLVTTLLNPFLLRASEPFSVWLERRLPPRALAYLETYGNWVERVRHSSMSGETQREIRINLILLVLQLALVAVIFLAASMLAQLDLTRFTPFVEANKKALLWGAACLLAVPNFVFVFFRARSLGEAVADGLTPARVAASWAQAFRRFVGILFAIAGVVFLFAELAMLSGSIMPEPGWSRGLVLVTFLACGALGWKRFRALGADALETFRSVLAKETDADATLPAADLLDIHTERMPLQHAATVCGRSLRELDVRARTGASVIGIERDGRLMVNPAAGEKLAESDVVLLLGDDEQIAQARALLR